MSSARPALSEEIRAGRRGQLAEGGFDALSRDRQIAEASAGRIGNRIGERGGGRPLAGLAGAQERHAGPIEDLDFHGLRHGGKS